MINQEIFENNKLIAEFMGWKLDMYGKPYLCSKCISSEQEYKFQSSYDWLIPVIEKISQYKYEDDTRGSAYPRTFGMIDEEGNYMFRFNRHQLFKEKTLIEAAHKAVVDFIKWYNTQDKK